MRLLPALLLAACACAHGEVKVSIGEISDRRTTGKFFKGLELTLKLSGPELAEAKGMRATIKDAADDTGKALQPNERAGDNSAFQPLKKPFGSGFGGDKAKADEFELKLEFENPARAAKTLKAINGAVELLMPARDPQSVITAHPVKDAGKALANPALQAAGVEITFTAPKGNEFGYSLKDAGNKIAAVEFCSPDGKPLETQGRMTSRFNKGPQQVSVTLESAPADAIAKIYLLTDKSVLNVPIALNSVPLP